MENQGKKILSPVFTLLLSFFPPKTLICFHFFFFLTLPANGKFVKWKKEKREADTPHPNAESLSFFTIKEWRRISLPDQFQIFFLCGELVDANMSYRADTCPVNKTKEKILQELNA